MGELMTEEQSRPEDVAYLKGFSDGWENVAQLTFNLYLTRLICLIELALIAYLLFRLTRGYVHAG